MTPLLCELQGSRVSQVLTYCRTLNFGVWVNVIIFDPRNFGVFASYYTETLLYSNFRGPLYSRTCQAREIHEIKGTWKKQVWQYHCLNATAPHYLAETIRQVSSRGTRQHLRSAETSTLLVPSTRRLTHGDRSFPVAAARAWNALPQHVRNAPSVSVFRRELKTVLFRSSFPDAIWQCTVLYLRARRSVLICHHLLVASNWFC